MKRPPASANFVFAPILALYEKLEGKVVDRCNYRSFYDGYVSAAFPWYKFEPEPWYIFDKEWFELGKMSCNQKMEEFDYLPLDYECIDRRYYIELGSGKLAFNEETACAWGGPFPGNFAEFSLQHWNGQSYNWIDPIPDSPYRETERKQQFMYSFCGMTTKDYPFRIWMYGNDDTSYSRVFATEELARLHLRVLASLQPLDIHQDVQMNGYEFTN